MALDTPGYSYLIEHYKLAARPLQVCACIDAKIKGRGSHHSGDQEVLVFEPKYQPENTLAGHLQFALRYEGINLEVLSLLFAQTGKDELNTWLAVSPTSIYARRAGFIYEWLTRQELKSNVPSKTRYVDLVDNEIQFGLKKGEPDTRYRVINNLPGNREFCPLVRQTSYLKEMVDYDLREKTRKTLAGYDQDLLRRAAAYLYLKETQSSFEVEREKPSPDRAQRFADLLRQADTKTPLTEERLVELQNAVLDPRFHEFTWRHQQNWVGKDQGYRKQIDFVPARPDDVPALMTGLLSLASDARNWNIIDADDHYVTQIDPVILASAIAFGFVFIHPFMDGNGRIHRYLIHEVLANAGFTPKGIILPVSAVILANLDDYIAALEAYSKPLRTMTSYNPDIPDIPATGNDIVYFRYFDATPQAEFLYRSLVRTVEEDLEKEINYLLGFDRAWTALNSLLDWPAHSLDLFIRVVQQNNGILSKTKRDSHFDWMTEEEIQKAQQQVVEAFETRI
ncbi:MAG: cell filamentation protein Fic [Gammaproteobacteria bacterium RIFCSPLOWO2_12_47_11]|nr:MAG: cell filamentation protein Fic [Gammaproteobacteria bacterium RIFCSPLOWO2_12_47_11]